MAHAIVGTGMLVGLASLMAIPVGILGGVYLAEYCHRRLGQLGPARQRRPRRHAVDRHRALRLRAVVVPVHHFSGWPAAIALAILMLPIVIRTTEGAVALIPNGLRSPAWRWASRDGAFPFSSSSPRPPPG